MSAVSIFTEVEVIQTGNMEVIVVCSDTPQELKVPARSEDFSSIISDLMDAWRNDAELEVEFETRSGHILSTSRVSK